MIIANPASCEAFERMMKNEQVAKFFLATILDQEIECIKIKPAALTYTPKRKKRAVGLLDIVATIKTKNNEYKKLLVQIEKVKDQIDIEVLHQDDDQCIENFEDTLPIVTIFLIGNTIPTREFPKLSIRYIAIHMNAIGNSYQTQLDKLLSVFEQDHFVGDDMQITKMFHHPIDLKEIKMVIDILHHTGTDPEARKRLKGEQEFWRTIYAMKGESIRGYGKSFDEKQYPLAEKEKLNAALLVQIEAFKNWFCLFEKNNATDEEVLEIMTIMEEKNFAEIKKKIAEFDKIAEDKKKFVELIEEQKSIVKKKKVLLDEQKRSVEEKKRLLDERKIYLEEEEKLLTEKDRIVDEMKRKYE